MNDLWEGVAISLVLAIIIGGCTYDNHLERQYRLEQSKIELELKKLNK